LFDERDIHIHVPEGATPKNGPSTGVAMVTAIVSVMTGIPVRRDLAMAGEITLRGRVWPITGLKEKLLAALRGGIKTVLIPEENAKDLVEIAETLFRLRFDAPQLKAMRADRLFDRIAGKVKGRSSPRPDHANLSPRRKLFREIAPRRVSGECPQTGACIGLEDK
jgi:hypothetical protein